MKEIILDKGGLTKIPKPPYARGGDIFMAEPGEGAKPMGVDEATRRLEIAAKVGEEARKQASARNFLEQNKEGLPTDIRRGLEEIAGQGGTPPHEPTAASGAGVPPGGEIKPPPVKAAGAGGGDGGNKEPPTVSGTPSEEPGNGEAGDIGSGITDPKLRNEIIAIYSSLAAGHPPEPTLSEALKRIALFETGYGTAEEQEQRSQQKQKLLQKVQNWNKNVIDKIIEGRLSARHEGMYGERKLTEEEKEQIKKAKRPEDIEELFNRMFDTVDSLPQSDFDTGFGSIGTFEYMEFLKVLNEEISELNKAKAFSRAKELGDIRSQFTKEKSARTIIHNAYFAVISGQNTEAVSNYMASFLTGYADLAFSKSGVVQAMHFYEQALLIVKAKHGGYLPAKDVIGNLKDNKPGEVNILTEEMLNDANSRGELMVNEKGIPIKDENGNPKQLAKWEIDRALSFARGMSVVTGKSIEIAATSILPGTESGGSAFTDLFAQKIIQELFLRHSGVKFQTSKDNKVTRVLAYLLDSKRTPWTAKEILEFDKMDMTEQIKVLNDLMPEGQERFLSILNPFEIGGWLSRTGWRIGGDVDYPGQSAIKEMLENGEEKWIGTGIIIERERDKLEKLGDKDRNEKRKGEIAFMKIKKALEQTARVTPLRFFLNVREFRERVLTDLLEMQGKDAYFSGEREREGILEEIDRRFKEREAAVKEEEEKEQELLKEKAAKKPGEREGILEKISKGFDEREDVEKTKERQKKSKDKLEELRRKIEFEVIMENPKFREDMKELVLLQEKALLTKDETLVVGGTKEGKVVETGSKLGKILQDKFLHGIAGPVPGGKLGKTETFLELFLRRLEHKSWKTPFAFGTEDVPYNKYVFEETGARSGARRWADMAAAAKAGAAFSEFLNGIEVYTEQGQIVEAMHKIYHHIKDYNLEYAEKFSVQLAEGVMKFYGKTWAHRLPLGLGSMNSAISGNSSYAQIAFGRGKMAWDELQQNEFTRLLRDKGLIKVEQQQELQKRAGGGKKEVVWGYTRTVLPLIMLALAYYIATQVAKEEKS